MLDNEKQMRLNVGEFPYFIQSLFTSEINYNKLNAILRQVKGNHNNEKNECLIITNYCSRRDYY